MNFDNLALSEQEGLFFEGYTPCSTGSGSQRGNQMLTMLKKITRRGRVDALVQFDIDSARRLILESQRTRLHTRNVLSEFEKLEAKLRRMGLAI